MKKMYFYDINYKLQEGYIFNDLPLKKEKIQENCMEYFGDDDPCIIHINYITKKMILEMECIISESIICNQYYETYANKEFIKYLNIPIDYTYFMLVDENII